VSILVLVRHGQAMAFADDSDRLSPAGEEQSRRLGEWWRGHGIRFDEVWSGTLRRQRRTAELAGFPGAAAHPDWNEYDAEGIRRTLGPALEARDPEFRALAAAYRQSRGGAGQNRHFQRMFEPLIRRWMSGECLGAAGFEPWREFHSRVARALRRVTGGGAGRSVAVFTSGGVIGAAAQIVLGAPEIAAIELNWRIRNTSLTGMLFTPGRISLDYFNALPHLDDPSAWTFR
jgi:broad specificity phosphatase PhoE